MYLAEVKVEASNLEARVKQLKGYIGRFCGSDSEVTDEAVTQLFDLLEKLRSHNIAYSRFCNKITLTIGSSEVTLAEAKIILDTMQEKIEIVNALIDTGQAMDGLALMEQRDKLEAEYTSLSNALQSIEWSTKID